MSARISVPRTFVAQLERRYPGVQIVEAYMMETSDGDPQQVVRFQAPLELLKSSGLLTDDMLKQQRASWKVTALGDGFSLSERRDSASVPGCWDLLIYTGASPREALRPRTSVRDAQRVLKRIAKGCSKAA